MYIMQQSHTTTTTTPLFFTQDGTFSVEEFVAVFSEYDVQRVLRSYENSISIHLHCCQLGDWTQVPLYTWIFKHMVGRYVSVAREFDYFKAFVYISTSEISSVLFVILSYSTQCANSSDVQPSTL